MKITQAELEFISNDVYLNLTALVPTKTYDSWYLKKNLNVVPEQNNILDFTFYSENQSKTDELGFRAKTIRERVSKNETFNGLKVSFYDNSEVFRLHKVCLRQLPIGHDNFSFEILGIRDNRLQIRVEYAGGDCPHAFQLNWDGFVKYKGMIQIVMEISHNANSDQGFYKKSELLQFDLSDMFLLEQSLRIIIKSESKIGITTYIP